MSAFRWWLFRRLSEFGWWICPEPHKSNLQAVARAALEREHE